jgi:glycosyltransferase involved in cell wall biosynthesis
MSLQLREVLSQRTGFSANKIAVIHNGVDCLAFRPDPSRRIHIRQELGIADGEFCIGCVANFFPIKDHITLLKAMAEFSRVHRNCRLVLIGEGPELPKVTAFLAGDSSVSERVSILGSTNRVSEFMTALDVYVLPSLSEGISNSLLEAMATGVPPIVSATGGNPEVVVDRECGLLFRVGAVNELLQHLLLLREKPETARYIGEKALLRARTSFSIDSMVQRYEQLYRDLHSGSHSHISE